mmetsp:Transcript_7242/g.12085  ORF Transcript_7242/g.12085 Transcript_7242/m.12085 type:complete len:241 (+) Transcript_7242:170-892(+)
MDDQRHVCDRFDGANARLIQPTVLVLLQMHIADRDGHGIHAGLGGEFGSFLRVGPRRILAARIADKADLALAGNACGVGHFGNSCCFVDVLLQWLARPVEHERGEACVEGGAAFVKGIAMVEMGHDRHGCTFCQMLVHFAQYGQRGVGAAGRSGLQDHGHPFGLGCGHIGAHVLPSQCHQPGNGVAVFQSRLQDLCKGRQCHLNLAIMSLMPGMVSSWAACVGWKYCTSERWLSPPRMVK